MFEYNIKAVTDNQAFMECCSKIEAQLEGLEKEDVLIDVDGSMIQIYKQEGKSIKVFNDYEVDAVYVESEIQLNNMN